MQRVRNSQVHVYKMNEAGELLYQRSRLIINS